MSNNNKKSRTQKEAEKADKKARIAQQKALEAEATKVCMELGLFECSVCTNLSDGCVCDSWHPELRQDQLRLVDSVSGVQVYNLVLFFAKAIRGIGNEQRHMQGSMLRTSTLANQAWNNIDVACAVIVDKMEKTPSISIPHPASLFAPGEFKMLCKIKVTDLMEEAVKQRDEGKPDSVQVTLNGMLIANQEEVGARLMSERESSE